MPRVALVLLLAAAAPLIADRRYRDARLLETALYPADKRDRIYVCLGTETRVIIGHTKRSRWKYDTAPGADLAARWDGGNIWVRMPDGRDVKLREDFLTRAFPAGSTCAEVVDAAWRKKEGSPKTLHRRADQ